MPCNEVRLFDDSERPTGTTTVGFFVSCDPRLVVTKKRFLLIAAVPLAIAVTLGVLALLPARPTVTKANFDRIDTGMTLAEVEQILGKKGELALNETQNQDRLTVWAADDGSKAYICSSDDCVTIALWNSSNETLLEKIRRWLHLR